MSYSRLFVLLEGNDDERFYNKIIKPVFEKKFSNVMTYKYAEVKNEKVANFIRSIVAMNADYILLTDINSTPCVTQKKSKIIEEFNISDSSRIFIVVKEIESWYLAGIDMEACKDLKISYKASTDSLTKEDFDALIPKKFQSRIDFMAEILKCFSIDAALTRNISFNYFFSKLCQFN